MPSSLITSLSLVSASIDGSMRTLPKRKRSAGAIASRAASCSRTWRNDASGCRRTTRLRSGSPANAMVTSMLSPRLRDEAGAARGRSIRIDDEKMHAQLRGEVPIRIVLGLYLDALEGLLGAAVGPDHPGVDLQRRAADRVQR